jgi:hypothetical protein
MLLSLSGGAWGRNDVVALGLIHLFPPSFSFVAWLWQTLFLYTVMYLPPHTPR